MEEQVKLAKFGKSLLEALKKDLVRTPKWFELLDGVSMKTFYMWCEKGDVKFRDLIVIVRNKLEVGPEEIAQSDAAWEMIWDQFNRTINKYGKSDSVNN